METKYVIPYGDASFETFNKENVAFVDKTEYINILDKLNTKYPIY